MESDLLDIQWLEVQMPTDVTIGAWVIPGVLVSAGVAIASGFWTWLSASRLKKLESNLKQRELELESRFKQQDEAFRLAHSPRVTAAVKLWATFCEYERCLRAQLSPMRVYSVPEGVPREEAEREKEEQRVKQERAFREATAAAWGSLKVARDEAEVLLPGPVFSQFDQLFKFFNDAHGEQWASEMIAEPGRNLYLAEAMKRIFGMLDKADKLRPDVVAGLRSTIEGPAGPAAAAKQ
jgi:hypothetical protein